VEVSASDCINLVGAQTARYDPVVSSSGSGRLPIDQARLRPHLRERTHLEQKQADVFQREYERAEAEGVDRTRPGPKVPTGDDWQRLRGLPMIARGVRGAQRGSDPLAETIRRSERHR
jgi:hypothetical protein